MHQVFTLPERLPVWNHSLSGSCLLTCANCRCDPFLRGQVWRAATWRLPALQALDPLTVSCWWGRSSSGRCLHTGRSSQVSLGTRGEGKRRLDYEWALSAHRALLTTVRLGVVALKWHNTRAGCSEGSADHWRCLRGQPFQGQEMGKSLYHDVRSTCLHLCLCTSGLAHAPPHCSLTLHTVCVTHAYASAYLSTFPRFRVTHPRPTSSSSSPPPSSLPTGAACHTHPPPSSFLLPSYVSLAPRRSTPCTPPPLPSSPPCPVSAARCEQMRALFGSGMRDAQQSDITTPESFSREAVEGLLHW